MADEVTYVSIGDLRLAETMSAEYLLLNASRDALPNHPALFYVGDAKGSDSATKKIPIVGLHGHSLMGSVSDGGSVGNTALPTDSVTVTVGRFSKKYTKTDLAGLTGSNGILSPEAFAVDAVVSGSQTLVDLIAQVTDGFTATAGTTGVPFSIETLLVGKGKLERANVKGPYLAILEPEMWTDATIDAYTNAGGAVQFDPATPEMIRKLGTGYKGDFGGVQIFTTTRVPSVNADADHAGAIFGFGAVAWGDASLDAEDPTQQMSLGGKILFERDRQASEGQTSYVSHYYIGASMGIDECGVTLIGRKT